MNVLKCLLGSFLMLRTAGVPPNCSLLVLQEGKTLPLPRNLPKLVSVLMGNLSDK